MRFALVVCLKDLRQRLRDRTALLVAVVVPLVLAGLIGFSIGSNEAGFQLRLALVDLDRGPHADALRAFLARPWLDEVVLLEPAASPEAAAAMLAADEADAALVVRRGFLEPAGGDAGTGATSPHEAPGLEVLASGHDAFATRMTVALAERFRIEAARRAGPREGTGAGTPLASMLPVSPGGRLRPVDYFAFSMTVLFLTFTVLSGVRALQEEVDAGALARLVASPAPARSIVAGKLLGLLLLGWLQMGTMILATRLLFGTHWGPPWIVAALVFTTTWMAIGMTSFFMAAARNAEQGHTLASITIFLLAVVGGQFMPPQGLPDVFDTLQRLTPNGQAARGFMDAAALGSAGSSFGGVWEPLLVTFAVGCAGIAFAARRAGDALTRSV